VDFLRGEGKMLEVEEDKEVGRHVCSRLLLSVGAADCTVQFPEHASDSSLSLTS